MQKLFIIQELVIIHLQVFTCYKLILTLRVNCKL